MARAVAAPRPEPPPVMRTATSFNCMLEPLLGRFFSGLRTSLSRSGRVRRTEDTAAQQRFHMPDVLPAHFLGDRTDAAGARHGLAAEEQVIAGADQAGVEQHRIHFAEFAAPDALVEQAALKVEQG